MERLEKIQSLLVDTAINENGDAINHVPKYRPNMEFEADFENIQDAVRFLIEAIRYWYQKHTFFCHDNNYRWGETDGRYYLPEDQWSFDYKTPSGCGGCVKAQQILDLIFGSRDRFNALPFVKYLGDREYEINFGLMKFYAEYGNDATLQLIEEREQEAVCRMAEAEAEAEHQREEEKKMKLSRRFGETRINDELQRQILKYAEYESLVIVDENIALVLDERSDRGTSGGIGYFDQVRVFYGGKSNMQEWQWRDRYNSSADRPDLRVQRIGKVEVARDDDRITLTVELVNEQYGNRSATFTFSLDKTI